MSKKLGAVQIPKLAGAALCLQGFVLLFSATPVFSALSLHFANFLRSGGKLGLFCFPKLTDFFNFDLRVFFTRFANSHFVAILATILLWRIVSCKNFSNFTSFFSSLRLLIYVYRKYFSYAEFIF